MWAHVLVLVIVTCTGYKVEVSWLDYVYSHSVNILLSAGKAMLQSAHYDHTLTFTPPTDLVKHLGANHQND